ncbi:uncharacterized protein LOC111870570, partial [Cryptotermes secundus]|uniref:uncharacterized protein LOC111870570 n=1 Tax=Cryptotermes secundus TaxID=105785 RepID=UPI000CD7AF94
MITVTNIVGIIISGDLAIIHTYFTIHIVYQFQVIQNIIETSKSWPLVVSKCAIECNRVQLYLNRKLTFKYVLHSVLSQKCMYGQFSSKQQRFVITSDGLQEDRSKMDLSELRIELLRSTVTNLLKAVGYKMADMEKSCEEESIIYLHLSAKSSSDTVSGYERVICGVVTNSRHHCKESTITAQEYL